MNAAIPHVLDAVASWYGVTADDIRGRDQQQQIQRARRVACWLLKELGCSLTEIGDALGKRNHATIWSALRSLEVDVAVGGTVLPEALRDELRSRWLAGGAMALAAAAKRETAQGGATP